MTMTGGTLPWYRRVRRWGQTNITEADPPGYDLAFWREHWQRTRVQGIIVNAGGIVAYYPSRFELQYRAAELGGRDLFGDVLTAGREMGLAVLARMDSNRAEERFYQAHPDWFTVDAQGQPYRAQDRYIACINSPYYGEYLPQVLIEIIERYHPEGFTDNSWSGLGREAVCHCRHCAAKFRAATGRDLPRSANWDDPAYRQWIRWSYDCRLEVWDLNNSITQQHGGSDCLWLGMVNANAIGGSRAFRDLRRLGQRAEIIMCDHQSRDASNGFEQNGLNGKLLHGVSGWDKVIPESMAMYVRGQRPFRVSANPPEESRLWMIEGFAGGISPWWHHIGAHHEDRRQYTTAEPLMRWHEANEPYLYDRQPVANVGIVWSHENIDFFGRDEAEDRVAQPLRGWTMALTRARIPYLPVHIDQLGERADQFKVLILPNLGAMSDAQAESIRSFVQRGGSLIATGQSSLYDEWGDRRSDFALADVLGAHPGGPKPPTSADDGASWDKHATHTYLRLPASVQERHLVLRGFEETDILPFGGGLEDVSVAANARVVATYIPPFPIYPPEFCWMRTPRTEQPTVVAREAGRSRIAYLPADIDRCHARSQLPDHADLLANLVRWAARDSLPLTVRGPGYLDCHLYRQGSRLILHIVNLSCARAWPAFVEEHLAAGPLDVSIAIQPGCVPKRATLCVAGGEAAVAVTGNRIELRVPAVGSHEMVVVE